MLKRTLYIPNPYKLSLKNNQLVLRSLSRDFVQSVPVEDIGFVILDNPQISFTMRLIEELNAHNVATVFCDHKHMPSSMNLILDSNNIQNEIFKKQIEASEPLKKNIWKQTIEAKIRNQSLFLAKLGKENRKLENLGNTVRSGDLNNREGFAARIYWNNLFGQEFIRDRYGGAPNPFLNYGYILLRSAVARALSGSGLLATLGIHHRNRYNAFCLADDIMEPFRPYVDEIVYQLYKDYPDVMVIEREHKVRLLKLMSIDVNMGSVKRPLMIALTNTTASLARCFSGESRKMNYPVFE